MIKFETITGSLYEVDFDKNQVRRLIGLKDPTPRQGTDGNWKQFKSCTEIIPGSSVIFVWNIIINNELIAKTTMTSPVKKIIDGYD